MSGVEFPAYIVRTQAHVSWVRYYKAPFLKLISAANSFTVPCVTALMGHRTVSLTEHHPLCTLSVVSRTHANSVFFGGWRGTAPKSVRKHGACRHEYLKGALKWRNSLLKFGEYLQYCYHC